MSRHKTLIMMLLSYTCISAWVT